MSIASLSGSAHRKLAAGLSITGRFFSDADAWPAWGTSSRHAEVFQRSASGPATDIRFDDQFEYINVVKIHLILFNFANRFGWTENPLLANNLFKGGPAI